MRWALENKRQLIPAFGYEKRGPAGERIKAAAKLAYIERARGEKERRGERDGARGAGRCRVSEGPD